MKDQEQTIATEVLDNSPKPESTPSVIEAVDNVADETINTIDNPDLTTPPSKEDEEVTLDNVELPIEKKELTNSDYILKRKQDKIEREKTKLIQEKNAEIERLKQAHEEASKRAFLAEVNSIQAPIRENFETEEEFIDSRLQYNLAKNAAERINQEENYKISKSKEIFAEKVSKAEQIGQDKYHDFDEVTHEIGKKGILTNVALVEAVLDSEYSADVFYIMGKYPAIREKLNSMEPIKAIKELAKLEQRFEQQLKSKKVVQPAKKIIEPITNGKNGTSVKKPLDQYTQADLDKLTLKEFTKLRKEQSKFSTY